MRILPSLLIPALTAALAFGEPSFAGELTVGVIAPLSGDLAEYGAAVRNGIELAREGNPEQYARVRIIYEDNRYEAARSIAAFSKLVTLDRADLIYLWGEAPLYSVAPLADRYKIPVVAMSADARPAAGRKYVIRSLNSTDHFALMTLQRIRALGYRRLGVVKSEDPFVEALTLSMQKFLAPEESLEVIQTAAPDESDFRAIIGKAKQAQLDALGVYLLSGQVGLFYRQAGGLRLDLPTFGFDSLESRKEIAAAGRAVEGAIFPALYVPEEFARLYLERFQTDYQIPYAYNAYAFAKLLPSLRPLMDQRTRASALPERSDILRRLLPEESFNLPFSMKRSAEGPYYEFPMIMRQVRSGWVEDL